MSQSSSPSNFAQQEPISGFLMSQALLPSLDGCELSLLVLEASAIAFAFVCSCYCCSATRLKLARFSQLDPNGHSE